MKQSDKNTISKIVGVEPIELDAADFSAQDRKRLYWTNIPDAELSLKNMAIAYNWLKDEAEDWGIDIEAKYKEFAQPLVKGMPPISEQDAFNYNTAA